MFKMVAMTGRPQIVAIRARLEQTQLSIGLENKQVPEQKIVVGNLNFGSEVWKRERASKPRILGTLDYKMGCD